MRGRLLVGGGLALVAALVLVLALTVRAGNGGVRQTAGPVGLFTTLPILWSESADIAGLLRADATPHWARAVLDKAGGVVPIDNLARLGSGARQPDLVIMAQPRPLSPQENVAIDEWVRRGGRVLLFADPMLTAPSAYPLGDRRRPQDVVLISPLLGHWGLRLTFDEAQPLGPREVTVAGVRVQVDLPGRLEVLRTDGSCVLMADGHAARCRLGRGSALIVADAALLQASHGDDAVRADALAQLVAEARRQD